MEIDVWSDVMCPWCAVGRANLEAALDGWAGEPVNVRWRAFELQPDAPRVVEGDYAERLGRKYGRTRDQALQMLREMEARGRSVGIPMDFSRAIAGNTFDAHRLLHLAHEHGLQDALKGRLFRAYLCEGEAVGTHEVLQRLAVEVGLPADAVADVLASDRYGREVRGEQALARQLGVSGVPFFVIDQRLAVSGAQPPEVLRQALEHAVGTRAEHAEATAEACGPDGCEV